MHTISTLNAQLDQVLNCDRLRLQRRLQGLQRRQQQGLPVDRGVTQLAAQIAASIERHQWRLKYVPRPEFANDLPVTQRRDEITKALRHHQVMIVAGETGSGKTTQLPKICLAAGRGIHGLIGHTQPRRIAARTLADRIAEELHTELGKAVGYKVRFNDQTSADGFVKVMTDGILLAEIQHDPDLTAYDTLIIDEAHERSLNVDFLLGYLKRLLPRRPDLKVIITSATIDTARFAEHFGDAPVVEVTGRSYPVALHYRPRQTEDGKQTPLSEAVVAAVQEFSRRDMSGDILVFLAGEREIRETADALRKQCQKLEVLPLYARLSAAAQAKVFSPGNRRRVVLATNVAETSLTVPRIGFVIDPGTARISRYSSRARVQRLPVERISQASANQRMGRCGRVQAGQCIRLYSEGDFNDRPAFTEPEIRRTHLAAVILRMLSLGLGEIDEFPFLDPPERRQIHDGYDLLLELEAVDGQRNITPLGRKLASFSLDPRLARMILAADREGALAEVLILAAGLSIQDPRERPADHRPAADQAHARFKDPHSDFVALLNLWRYALEQLHALSGSAWRKRCKAEYLSFARLREWRDLHRELRQQVRQMKLTPNTTPASNEALHRALLTGLLGHVGERQQKREYRGAHQSEFLLAPGSGLTQKPPHWLVAAEIVETEKRYARTCARVEPGWIEKAAGKRLKRSYSEAAWDSQKGAVYAWERTTLYGLVLTARRRVHYGPIQPQLSREIFIREALVAGRLAGQAPFIQTNRSALEQAERELAKQRIPGSSLDLDRLYNFFDERVPPHIHNARSLHRWRKTVEPDQPDILVLPAALLTPEQAPAEALLPDQLVFDGHPLSLDYHFRLGHPADGVTVTLPIHLLHVIEAAHFDWLVPGMLADKAGALIKGLPKQWRKQIQPWPHHAGAFAREVNPAPIPLHVALGDYLLKTLGVQIPAEAWAPERLPAHLHMRFVVVDATGKPLGDGRDLALLRATLAEEVQAGFDAAPKQDFEQSDCTEWAFGELPTQVTLGSAAAVGYPALIDRGTAVDVRVLATPEEARIATRDGLMRLLLLGFTPVLKAQRKAFKLKGTVDIDAPSLFDDLTASALDRLLDGVQLSAVRSPYDFQQLQQALQPQLMTLLAQSARHVRSTLAAYGKVVEMLDGPGRKGNAAQQDDIQDQLKRMMGPGFARATPPEWLPHLARYLGAVQVRLTRLDQHPGKDQQRLDELTPLWTAFWQRIDRQNLVTPAPIRDPNLLLFRYQLEELRVSLFAQELKTSLPVSVARLTARWQELC